MDGCVAGNMDKVEDLKPVEVREYEGERLSSVDDFRENSIKGPQQVDTGNYRLNISGLVENPRSYAYDEVISNHQHYRKVVTLNCVEGWSVNILWEGVLVAQSMGGITPVAQRQGGHIPCLRRVHNFPASRLHSQKRHTYGVQDE